MEQLATTQMICENILKDNPFDETNFPEMIENYEKKLWTRGEIKNSGGFVDYGVVVSGSPDNEMVVLSDLSQQVVSQPSTWRISFTLDAEGQLSAIDGEIFIGATIHVTKLSGTEPLKISNFQIGCRLIGSDWDGNETYTNGVTINTSESTTYGVSANMPLFSDMGQSNQTLYGAAIQTFYNGSRPSNVTFDTDSYATIIWNK